MTWSLQQCWDWGRSEGPLFPVPGFADPEESVTCPSLGARPDMAVLMRLDQFKFRPELREEDGFVRSEGLSVESVVLARVSSGD